MYVIGIKDDKDHVPSNNSTNFVLVFFFPLFEEIIPNELVLAFLHERKEEACALFGFFWHKGMLAFSEKIIKKNLKKKIFL